MTHRLIRVIFVAIILVVVSACCTSAALEVLDAFYRPDRMLPEFFYLWSSTYRLGDDPPSYDSSGQLCVYIRNTGTSSVTISDAQLQGISLTQAIGCETKAKYQNQLCYACSLHYPSSNPITSTQRQTLIDAGEPVWWRVLPSTIPAGGSAEVYVRMRTRVLTTLPLTIVPTSGASVPVSITVTNNDIPRVAGYALSSDMSKLYLYFRHMQNGKAPSQVIVDGVNVTANCTIAADPNLDMVPVVCNLAAPFTRGSFHTFQAVYDDGTKSSAGVRVFYDGFIHCVWGGPSTTTDAEAADYIRSMGYRSLNIQVLGPGFGSVGEYMATDAGKNLMSQYGILRMHKAAELAEGKLWGLFICDEPDGAEPSVPGAVCPTYARPGVMAMSGWYRADGFRVSNPTVPTVVNIGTCNRPFDWYHYGQLSDIFCSDPYFIIKLKEAYWKDQPQQEAVYSKMTYTYGWSCTSKAASEPRPYQCIINCARLQMGNKVWRWSTPQEHRIQAYFAIAGGATQLAHWWLSPKMATEAGSAGVLTDEPAAAALWREIGLIGAELGNAGPVIQKSSPVQIPIKSSGQLWVRALIGAHDTLTLICVNDDYSANETGVFIRPIASAEVSLDLPNWLNPVSVFEIDYKGVRDVPYNLSAPHIDVHLGKVDVTRLVIITSDSTLKSTLQSAYNTTYGPNVTHIIPMQ